MVAKALTDVAIRRLSARDGDYKVSDGRGLYLLVTVGGSRLWRLDYRLDGKRKTMAIGAYPDVGLADARAARDAAKALVARGIDPVAARRGGRHTRDGRDEARH